MPTAVLDLDLLSVPGSIQVPTPYDRALVLVRLGGRPVAQVTVQVIDGRIDGATLRRAMVTAGGNLLFDQWTRMRLRVDEVETPGADIPAATVAICTRDRPDDLRLALTGLTQMPDEGQEILVVDNRSAADTTRRTVALFPGVRYVREDRPGLNVARNRALREARHEVVAFIDDDAVPDTRWLRALVRNFTDPRVYAVTGLTMPLELETGAQESFERYGGFGRGFDRRVFESPPYSPMAAGRIGAGVNMAVRQAVLDDVGPFDEALDAGTRTQSGGDHELFSRILAAGYRIVYDPAALNWHRHRRTDAELTRTVYGYGVGAYAAWTRAIVTDREFGAVKVAWSWLRQDQLPAIARLLTRSSSERDRLIAAEVAGAMIGPLAYVTSRRERRREERRR